MTANEHILASWRGPLARALHRNRSQPHARYIQLATSRVDGTPANRTVVFRGFLDQSDQLLIYTDIRSQKITQLTHQPIAEICWYFCKTREQFRLRGITKLVTAQTTDEPLLVERANRWQQWSAQGQAQFYWPDPGAPREQDKTVFEVSDQVSGDEPPDTFALLLLEPYWVEHLELREEPQQRTGYQLESSGRWSSQLLNP